MLRKFARMLILAVVVLMAGVVGCASDRVQQVNGERFLVCRRGRRFGLTRIVPLAQSSVTVQTEPPATWTVAGGCTRLRLVDC